MDKLLFYFIRISQPSFIKKYLIILSLFLLIPAIANSAANHYVRAGATGSATGNDWTNAYTALPATLIRGDTYYIANGNYTGYTIDDAVSGELVITIKKATISDHGTDTGWDDSYGDDQAIFQSSGGLGAVINIKTSYVIFDGQTGSGADSSSYGFSIVYPKDAPAIASYLLGCPGIGNSKLGISNVTIAHVAMTNYGYDLTNIAVTQIGLYSYPAYSSNMTIRNCYFKNSSSNIVIRNTTSNVLIHDNYFDGNWSNDQGTSGNHGQQISPGNCDNVSVYNNTFVNSTIFVVGAHNEGGGNSFWKIYNNIVIGGKISAIWAMGESAEYDGVISWQVHHNTHINVNCGGRGVIFTGKLTDVANQITYAYNNLFYGCSSPRMDNSGSTSGTIVHTNNAYYNSTGTFDNSEDRTATVMNGDPFVDIANGDYRLKCTPGAMDSGKVLSEDFIYDYDGNKRPIGPGWDIGAYECIDIVTEAPPGGVGETLRTE